MKSIPKEPPRIAIKFANMVFVLGILYSILLVVYVTYKIYNLPETVSPTFYIISMLFGVVFATLFGLGIKRLTNNLKVNLSLLFFTIGITVYGFETYLEFKPLKREIIAKQMGVPYDTRTSMKVLEDLKDSGFNAFPNIFPSLFIKSNGLTSKKGRIYPLGTISNSTTILGNESGYYPIVKTDEHGFNNSKGLYIENNVDIILTGDSYTEGYSVHSNENISAVLRQSDFAAINIGKGSNGPLLELAALKEYAEPLKPKIVLWLYYVNDLSNLTNREMQSSILRKYLNEDDYSQNLISRQEEIDDVLINYLQVDWEKEKKKFINRERPQIEMVKMRIMSILKLNKLRIMINLMPLSNPAPIFRDILSKSNQMVLGWGGKMYFVYLPSFERYTRGNEHKYHDFVMKTVKELEIPIIEIHKEVFDPHPDPLSLFPFRIYSHYNAEGYKLVAEAIGKRLEEDGYVPIKSKK